MISFITKALDDIVRPECRSVMLRSTGLAILIMGGLWFLLQKFASSSIDLPYGWLDSAFTIFTSFGIFIGALYCVPAVIALVAGLFLDDIAETLERHHYGETNVGKAMPFAQGMLVTVQFTLVVFVANLCAFALLLVPGINITIFLVLNGYLLGREYFELAVFRHTDKKTAKVLRKNHGLRIFLLGLVIAGYLAIPILNLTTPLFATALMVHYAAYLRRNPL